MIKPLIFLSVWVVVVAARATTPGDNRRSISGALEVIKRLGESRAGEVKVVQGRPPRLGESPIYYIRLPPSAYYFTQNAISASAELPHHKVSVDFINNGKPHKVYHWNLPLYNSPIYRPTYQPVPPSTTTTTTTTTTTKPSSASPQPHYPTTTPSPPSTTPRASTPTFSTKTPHLSTMSPETSTVKPHLSSTMLQELIATTDKPSKRPWLTLKKGFVYNGKPSKVYIWSPRSSSPVTVSKYRRARVPF